MSTSKDTEAPMAYVRTKKDYKQEEAKFVYEREVTSRRTINKTVNEKIIQETETTTEMTPRKVILKVYGHTEEEDCEHFMECFERLQTEMAAEWLTISKAKGNDAKNLFNAFENMVVGSAKAEWHDVLMTTNDRDWESFKTLVSKFICSKILPDDAYNRQVTYMQERTKPMALTAKDWWLRMQTLNRYLPYFIPSREALKREFPTSDFTDWWKQGGIDNTSMKRIVMNKVPINWQNRLREHDIGHEYRNTKTTSDLIDYFTFLETLEKTRSTTLRRTSAGRTNMSRNRYFPSRRSAGRQYDNYGRDPRRVGYYQAQRAAAPNNNNMNNAGYQRPGTYNQHMQSQGGRFGRNQTYGRNSGRFGGQRSGRGGFQPGRGGGFQGQRFNNQYQRPSGTAFFQENEGEYLEPNANEDVSATHEEHVNDQFANMSEEEIIDAWNESLFLDPPQEETEVAEDETQEFQDSYEDGFYEEEEIYDAAQDEGSYYG